MADENRPPRNERVRTAEVLRDCGLSPGVTKPNMVRIEILDGQARKRYLGQLQRAGDLLRTSLYDKMTNRPDQVFFGFLKKVFCPFLSALCEYHPEK